MKHTTLLFVAGFSILSIVSLYSYAATTVTTKVTTTKATTTKAPVKTVTTKVTTPVFIKSAWIPYWKKNDGASTTLANLKYLTEISPFAYEVNNTGSLTDAPRLSKEPWKSLVEEARKRNIKIYPSILWIDRAAMEDVLNDKVKRKAHIEEIISEVTYNKYDGIDIDYEGKSAETRVGFSAFLTELSKELHKKNKKLICTIEARTPVDSRYSVVTQALLNRIEYSNDYKVIGKVCDQVRIMTYDQIGGDVRLSNENSTTLYRPVADINWVEKVLTLTLRDIPANKIVVGVATYGYKYEITRDATGYITYRRIGSMNYQYADELVKDLRINPTRNIAGELSFSYSTTTDLSNKKPGTPKEYLVWYSDSVAIADKIRLAKLYNLAGVAIFKIDGSNDPKIWDVLK
jgi:spore germination protein YaaH